MSSGLSHLRHLGDDEWVTLEAVADRFAAAWRRGERPPLTHFLPPDGPTRRPFLIELAHTELELRLKAGEPARVEELLEAHPELTADPAVIVELAKAEWELRRRVEPAVALAEYVARFPAYAAAIADGWPQTTVDARSPDRTPFPADAPPAIPGYEVFELLGRGGMGVVYRGRQVSLDRPVAVKLLPAEAAREPLWLVRFRREARTASALNHPHICTVYDTGEAAGRPFISMELVEGRTLGAVAAARPPVGEVVPIVRQVSRALAAAHAAGVVHRDVKPENLMLRPDGIVKVLDFGLARRPADPTASAAGVAGTPAYMAPEQARGEEVGPPADIYALGLVLYELLTGRHACPDFRAVVLGQPLTPPPVSQLAPDVPQWLDALVERMLAHDPRQRPTAREVEAHLTAGLIGGAGAERRRPPPEQRAGVAVGRRAALDSLHAALADAANGLGSVVFVTGEPGDGKTTLVKAFLAEAARSASCAAAVGRCSERLAGAEAYLPVLEALDGLARGDGGAAEALRRVAPSWQTRLGAGADALAGPPQERLKREFAALLAEVSWVRPLVLVFDDAHWADPSSTDLLAYLGGRVNGLRVLIVVTYRPSDVALARHPLGPLKLDLVARRLAREVALEPLTPADLAAYLDVTFPGHRFPADFQAMVYSRTAGHPLFTADLLRYLRDRGAVVPADGGWALTRAVDALAADLPESVRSMVERELGQVTPADRRVLDAACVQGAEFDAGVLAAALGRPPEDVEERLEDLDRAHALVRFVRADEAPAGGLSLRYRFAHVLYQNTLLTALRPTRQVALSRATAAALLARQSDGGSAAAAELAMLFEAAREPGRATAFYRRAARNAVKVSAHQEAVTLARRGLALLPKLPPAERGAHERPLLVALGVSLMATRGFAAPEVEETYHRAAEVTVGEAAADRYPVLYGLWNVYLLRAEVERCATLAGEMAALAAGHPDPVLAVQAANVVQQPLVHRGEFAAALVLQDLGLQVYATHPLPHLTAVYGEDPGIGLHLYRAIAVWALGRPDEAETELSTARTRAVELGHPFDLARTLYFGGFLHLLRGKPASVREAAAELGALAAEEGFPLLAAGSRFLRGWADAQEGDPAGVPLMRSAVVEWQATGTVSHRPHQLTLLGRAVSPTDAAEALALFDEAEALTRATGERFLEAELHRLRGEVLAGIGRGGEAIASLRRAVAVARGQGAAALEQRATATLLAIESGSL